MRLKVAALAEVAKVVQCRFWMNLSESGCSVGCAVDYAVDCAADYVADHVADWAVGCAVGCVAGCAVGCAAGCAVGCAVGRGADYAPGCAARFALHPHPHFSNSH